MSDGLSPEKIAQTLAAIDEFIHSGNIGWEMPSELLGSRLNGGTGKRCPKCRGHLMMRMPRIYTGLLRPGGPIVDLQGARRSKQARLIGIGLRVSYVDAIQGMTEEEMTFQARIESLHRLAKLGRFR
ncbi:MAG TPA: hypothetical protein VEO20_01720 [Thermoplasmata archaeon]|nr:hypothetical protein [Thermoplasmata archaeon]